MYFVIVLAELRAVREWRLKPIGNGGEPQDSYDLERLSPRLGFDKRVTTEKPFIISGLPKEATGATGTTFRLDRYIDSIDSLRENFMINS
jgi:hypothetical protein